MLAVPRHVFLSNFPEAMAYDDVSIPVKYDGRGNVICSATQPSTITNILQKMRLEPGQNVLEIGTGTGYFAALIQHLVGPVGHVTTVEYDKTLVEMARDNLMRARMSQINVVHADGAAGYSPRASYDRIVATVGVWDAPGAWVRQLRRGGALVVPIYIDGFQVSAFFELQPDGSLYSSDNTPTDFVPLRGAAAGPDLHLYLGGGSSLRLYSSDVSKIDTAALHLLISEDAAHCHLGAALPWRDYWHGFVPYAMLNVPTSSTFVTYAVEGVQSVYGIAGHGFGLLQTGSATFVPDDADGNTHCFAGADSFLAVEALFRNWNERGCPRVDRLRLRLVPKGNEGPSGLSIQRMFARGEHNLYASLDLSEG